MDVGRITTVALHTLAMMIVLGYYGVLGRMVLPALRQTLDGPGLAASLIAVERRARPLLVLAIGLFAISGIYLTVIDEQYVGLGNIAGSTWAALILLKHLLVALLVGLGIVVDRLIEGLGDWPDGPPDSSLRLVGLAAEGVTVLGVIVIVMTAAAQFAPT